ncbi:Circadian clock-controlled protein [Gryllus bimaculatus]|nr:Circadian clock-controlled protein [Gryllus bimaculatus]
MDINLSSRQTAEYIKPCNRTDPKIEDCIRSSFNHLRPYLQKGIPELQLPPLEPMRVDNLAMENGNGAVRVRAVFSDVDVRGASNYTVEGVKADVSAYRIEMTLGLPRIETAGRYEVSGNVLLFPVRSRGDFWAAFHNVTAVARIQGREIVNNGTNVMKVERLTVDFTLGKARFRVRDQLNANNVLATLSIGRHFKSFLNGAFTQVPITVWLWD